MPADNMRFDKSGGVILRSGGGRKGILHLCGGSCAPPPSPSRSDVVCHFVDCAVPKYVDSFFDNIIKQWS